VSSWWPANAFRKTVTYPLPILPCQLLRQLLLLLFLLLLTILTQPKGCCRQAVNDANGDSDKDAVHAVATAGQCLRGTSISKPLHLQILLRCNAVIMQAAPCRLQPAIADSACSNWGQGICSESSCGSMLGCSLP
jgi:hypothetical protein